MKAGGCMIPPAFLYEKSRLRRDSRSLFLRFNFPAPFFEAAFQVVNLLAAVFAERLGCAPASDAVLAVKVDGLVSADFRFSLFKLGKRNVSCTENVAAFIFIRFTHIDELGFAVPCAELFFCQGFHNALLINV